MRKPAVGLLLLLCLVIYGLSAYGGIRSPDAEIMFRSGDSLASRGEFALAGPLESWPGFGAEKGRDGRLYPVFGPLQSVIMAGAILAGRVTGITGALARNNITVPDHYHLDNLQAFLKGQAPKDPPGSASRTCAAFVNVLAAAACVLVFRLIMLRLSRDENVANILALLLAFATALWPYSGTLFSEVPALFFVLTSFYALMPSSRNPGAGAYALSGAALGCAVLTHVSSLFFAPFFLAAAIVPGVFRERDPEQERESESLRENVLRVNARNGLIWCLGLLPLLALYGWYNFERFGNPLETGRTLALPGSPHHGAWVDPRVGLFGLLFSGGKGVFLFNPVLFAAVLFWGRLHRRMRMLSLLILAMVGARLLLIAARSEWHGGFSLGPRHLLLILPFLLLPLGFALRDARDARAGNVFANTRNRPAAFAFALFCFAHQAYLSFGEVFSFYHHHRVLAESRKINIFADHALYLDWKFSPLLHSHVLKRGPWSLQFTEGNDFAFALAIAAVATGLFAFAFHLWRSSPREP